MVASVLLCFILMASPTCTHLVCNPGNPAHAFMSHVESNISDQICLCSVQRKQNVHACACTWERQMSHASRLVEVGSRGCVRQISGQRATSSCTPPCSISRISLFPNKGAVYLVCHFCRPHFPSQRVGLPFCKLSSIFLLLIHFRGN